MHTICFPDTQGSEPAPSGTLSAPSVPLLSPPCCHVTRGAQGPVDTGAQRAGGPDDRAARLVDATQYMGWYWYL